MKTNVLKLKNFALIIIIGLVLSGCSKKDSSSTDNLIGTWTAGTVTFDAMIGDMTLTQYFTDVAGYNATEAAQYTALFNAFLQQSFMGTIQINPDGTYTSTMGGSGDSGTWSLSDDGKTLTINSSTDIPMDVKIVELTSNTLHIQMTGTESDDLNGDSVNETISLTADITFTKS
jgi:hypothetical protein